VNLLGKISDPACGNPTWGTLAAPMILHHQLPFYPILRQNTYANPRQIDYNLKQLQEGVRAMRMTTLVLFILGISFLLFSETSLTAE
jgi:hypothetical protein